jgi:hypothetical protein
MLETATCNTPSPGNASLGQMPIEPVPIRTGRLCPTRDLPSYRGALVRHPARDVKCMEQPRSGRRCSSYARTARRLWKRSDPLNLEVPHASRTSHSLDTRGGLLHGYLRRDPAGPSWRTVVKGKSAVLTGDLLNFKNGALRKLSGWAPFSFPLISEAGRWRRGLAGFTAEVSPAVLAPRTCRQDAGATPVAALSIQDSASRRPRTNGQRATTSDFCPTFPPTP